MSVIACIQRPFNQAGQFIQNQIIENEASLVGRVVKWLRAPEAADCTRLTRKVLAIFMAVALSATIVGIIPVVLAVKAWKVQEARTAHGAFGQNRDNVLNEPTTAIQPVTNADISLQQLGAIQFQDVAAGELLGRQADVQSVNPKHGIVALDKLQQSGLLPEKKLTVGSATYYCSKFFDLGRDHVALIALVEIEGKLYPRVFYHSNSQGTWRVMPFASKMLTDFNEPPAPDAAKKILHFGKGQCESDTQLPLAVITALNRLSTQGVQPNDYPAEKIVKTQGYIDPTISFNERVGIKESMFLKEGAPHWFYKTGYHVPRPPNPRDIQMPKNRGHHPDFSATFETSYSLPHYGQVQVKIFASKDKSLLYMFHEAEDGRAYLASIEQVAGASINSYGVRSKIVEAANMDAPLLEYHFQVAPGYEAADWSACRYQSQSYYSNWNYVRELELIKEYYKAHNRAVPTAI